MKHTLFMIAYTLYFTIKGFTDPFMAVMPYYTWAVLRPQATWEWSLPQGVRWSLYAAILGILVVFVNFGMRSFRNVKKGFIWVVAGFTCTILLSYVFSMSMDVAELLLEEYLKILLMMVVACYAISSPKHHRYLGLMILICLGYLIFNVNQLYIFDNRLDIFHNGYGGLDNNGAALMLAMAIPFMYYFFLAESRIWRWGYLAMTLPAAHAIMLTYSRGAMLSAVVTSVGMILVGSKKKIQSILAAALITTLVMSMAGPEVRHRFSTITEDTDDTAAEGSIESRYASWSAAIGIIKDYPALGVGLRNSPLVVRRYNPAVSAPVIHNLYLQVAADTGIPALAFLLLLMFLAYRGFWKASRVAAKQMKDKTMRWHYAVSMAGFWSLFMYCFGSLFLSTEVFELPYLLMVMGATAQGVMAKQDVKEVAEESHSVQQQRPMVVSPAVR
ncbi:MAG: O-antigen ligase family protein [Phycisphaerae bacterium]